MIFILQIENMPVVNVSCQGVETIEDLVRPKEDFAAQQLRPKRCD